MASAGRERQSRGQGGGGWSKATASAHHCGDVQRLLAEGKCGGGVGGVESVIESF